MSLRVFDYGAIATIGISLLGGVFWLGTLSSKIDAVNTDELDKKIESALLKIEEAKKNNLDQLPVGTVIASILEPKIFLSNGRNKKWHLADDSAVPLDSTYGSIVKDAAIQKKERLPDLRGVFLRGMNSGRSDGSQDPEGAARVAGSLQGSATALPTNEFTATTNMAGEHTHNFNKPYPYNADSGSHPRAKADAAGTTSPAGNHEHTVTVNSGGDIETRPNNVAVFYYIKIN